MNALNWSSLVLVSSLVAGGCNKTETGAGTDTAESAVDSSDSVSAEGDLIAANVDGAALTGAAPLAPLTPLIPLTGDQLATAIAANITATWVGGCAVVTSAGAVITATYNDCSGPRGLVHVDGELQMTVSVALSGAIGIHATATGFQVNAAELDIDADATYTQTGTQRSLAVTTTGSGTGPRGTSIDHEGDYTLTWDPTTTCGSISGHWQTDFSNASGAAQRSNDLDVTKCVNACPTGSLTHHYLGGASLAVAFDGSAVATWSASTGAHGSVALECR